MPAVLLFLRNMFVYSSRKAMVYGDKSQLNDVMGGVLEMLP